MSYITNSFITSDKDVPSCDKRMSICLETNGFSFSIVTVHNELLSVGAVAFDCVPSMSEAVLMIRNICGEHHISPIGYNEIELVVATSCYSLIPDELYEAGNDRKYIEPLLSKPLRENVYCAHNDALGAQVVFAADSNMVSAFKIAMPGIQVRCQYNKLINADLIQSSRMRSVMLLHLRKEAMDVVVYCNRKVQLVNTFPCADTEEATYTAVNIMKQLRLENAEFEVLLCGDIDRSRYAEMSRFFPKANLYVGRDLSKDTLELQHLHTYRHVLILS